MTLPPPPVEPSGSDAPPTVPTSSVPVPPSYRVVPPPAHLLTPEHFPTTVTRDGRIAWAFGLLGFIGFPGLATIVMSITLVILGLVQRGKNPVARAVGRRAAIFGAISLLATVVFFVLIFAVWPALEEAGVVSGDSVPMMFLMVPLAVWVAFGAPITGVVMGIVALTRPVSREKAERIYAAAGR
ncbi:hypothetical protein GCM10028787_08020 [Brachybacterium horti]|uniref:DUF4190 domain-containing protein n=1 Tax=Brachybacterium rhamnosum TaxID=173361 RepID=A0ABW4PZ64_9MICO|nr:hypothetical protein [Brachybacterium sp. SGAir0954]QCR52774.1 hypothetical protein C1N80_03720 [Brachybacterium sp. SGAir0954]